MLQRAGLDELIYLADNLSALSYQTIEEPLYVMFECDKVISVSGANVLQTVKETLLPRQTRDNGPVHEIDEDEATPEQLYRTSAAPPPPRSFRSVQFRFCFSAAAARHRILAPVSTR